MSVSAQKRKSLLNNASFEFVHRRLRDASIRKMYPVKGSPSGGSSLPGKTLTETLKVRLLGSFEVARGDEDLSRFPSRKAAKLFVLLALQPHKAHARSVLADALWPEHSEASARKRLRTELWMLRRFLDPEGRGSLFAIEKGCIGLHPKAPIWIDVTDLELGLAPFEDRHSQPDHEQCFRLERSLQLYRGDLLEGYYEEWCVDARECLRTRLLAALEHLMRVYLQEGIWASAMACGREILRLEPLIESVHRDLMRCHFEMGDRAAAVRQYRQCAALLESELDVEPMYETAHLYQQIRVHRGPGRLEVEGRTREVW